MNAPGPASSSFVVDRQTLIMCRSMLGRRWAVCSPAFHCRTWLQYNTIQYNTIQCNAMTAKRIKEIETGKWLVSGGGGVCVCVLVSERDFFIINGEEGEEGKERVQVR